MPVVNKVDWIEFVNMEEINMLSVGDPPFDPNESDNSSCESEDEDMDTKIDKILAGECSDGEFSGEETSQSVKKSKCFVGSIDAKTTPEFAKLVKNSESEHSYTVDDGRLGPEWDLVADETQKSNTDDVVFSAPCKDTSFSIVKKDGTDEFYRAALVMEDGLTHFIVLETPQEECNALCKMIGGIDKLSPKSWPTYLVSLKPKTPGTWKHNIPIKHSSSKPGTFGAKCYPWLSPLGFGVSVKTKKFIIEKKAVHVSKKTSAPKASAKQSDKQPSKLSKKPSSGAGSSSTKEDAKTKSSKPESSVKIRTASKKDTKLIAAAKADSPRTPVKKRKRAEPSAPASQTKKTKPAKKADASAKDKPAAATKPAREPTKQKETSVAKKDAKEPSNKKGTSVASVATNNTGADGRTATTNDTLKPLPQTIQLKGSVSLFNGLVVFNDVQFDGTLLNK